LRPTGLIPMDSSWRRSATVPKRARPEGFKRHSRTRAGERLPVRADFDARFCTVDTDDQRLSCSGRTTRGRSVVFRRARGRRRAAGGRGRDRAR
jgi:hypothetical protein